MKTVLLPLLLALLSGSALAANHYVRSGATGNGSGSDWTNACKDFSGSCAVSSLVRGDTYYVAAGTYAAVNFNTPTAGTAMITIQRATVSSHGADTGWSAAYDAQVHWAYNVKFTTSYWVFDGQTGSMVQDPAQYGFMINQPASCSSDQSGGYIGSFPSAAISNLTIKHFAIVSCGPSFNVQQDGMFLSCGGCAPLSNLDISDGYIHNTQVNISFAGVSSSIVERMYFDNNWSSSANHGDFLSFNTTANNSNTIRYSLLRDSGCQGIATVYVSPSQAAINGLDFYGNVLVNMSSGCNAIFASVDSSSWMTNVHAYNNTLVDSSDQLYQPCNPGASNCSQQTGQVFENNLFIRSSGLVTLNGAPAATRDYNAYYASSNVPSEAHGYVSASGDPTVNSASGDYHLSGPSPSAGLSLTSPTGVEIDPDGLTRGGDGLWDKGAYEYSANGSGIPGAPSALTAVVH